MDIHATRTSIIVALNVKDAIAYSRSPSRWASRRSVEAPIGHVEASAGPQTPLVGHFGYFVLLVRFSKYQIVEFHNEIVKSQVLFCYQQFTHYFGLFLNTHIHLNRIPFGKCRPFLMSSDSQCRISCDD